MKPLSMLRRIVALGLFAASLAVAGCGGGGGHSGSSASSAVSKTATAFKSGNFNGTFGAAPGLRTRGTAPTTSYIQLDNNAGVVAFSSGTVGGSDYRTYSADVANLDFTPGTSTATGATGALTFDIQNFTTNDFLKGNAHFAGTYTASFVGGTYTLTASGKITGTSPTGTAVTLGFGIDYVSTLPKADLSGNYQGTIDLPALTGGTVSTPWTGSLAAVDDLHLKATIATGSGSNAGTISFTGQNTRLSFAGAFDGGQVNSLLTGDFAQWYVRSDDGGATLTGAYFVVDATGAPVLNPLTQTPIYGKIAATRSSSTGGGGGTTATFKTGYYDGGVKAANGALDGRILKLNVTKVSATAGANGGMVIVTGANAGFNIGGRVATVTVSGSTATVTIDQISNTYTSIVLTGPISGTSFDAKYTATRLDGTTETGSLDQFGQGSTTTTSLTGTWTGTAASGGGTSSTFAATFKSNGDGTVLITPTSTVGGGTNPTVTLPAFTAFQAGSSFAGHASGMVNVNSLGQTFPVMVVGDFDGDVNGGAIGGDYIYQVSLPGSTTSLLEDSGTLSLTKH